MGAYSGRRQTLEVPQKAIQVTGGLRGPPAAGAWLQRGEGWRGDWQGRKVGRPSYTSLVAFSCSRLLVSLLREGHRGKKKILRAIWLRNAPRILERGGSPFWLAPLFSGVSRHFQSSYSLILRHVWAVTRTTTRPRRDWKKPNTVFSTKNYRIIAFQNCSGLPDN